MNINKSFWDGKKIFITGGTGFIGGHLTTKLTSLGAKVKLFIHEVLPQDINVMGYVGDLTSWYSELLEYLDIYSPDIVFHLAAQPIVGIAMENEFDTVEINVRGTYNLLHTCKKVPSIKAFCHISTDKVYGNLDIIRDDSPLLGTKHPYNASKLCGDILAQMYANSYDIPVTIVRNGNIYGKADLHFDRIIPRTIKNIFNSERPVLRGNGCRDYIYVDDIVCGYLKLVETRYEQKGLEIVNLGANKPTKTIELIDKILEIMGRVDLCPKIEPLWKGEIPNQHIISEKAKALIEWNPQVSLDAGLKLIIPWYIDYLKKEK